MLASSPSIAESPASPSLTFHSPSAHGCRHAARCSSASHAAHSPRFPVNNAAARRFDLPSSPKPSLPASPYSRARRYVDAGTQYTPPDRPATHRSLSPSCAAGIHPAHLQDASLTAPAIARARQGDAFAASVVDTEPSEALKAPERLEQPEQPGQSEQSEQLKQLESPELQEPRPRTDAQLEAGADNVWPPTSTGNAATGSGISVETTGQGAQRQVDQSRPPALASPAKRVRAHEDDVKIMPLQYESCDVKELAMLISDMLMELVRLNDGYPLRHSTLTRFHSRTPPGISVRDYLSRLVVHATLSPPLLLSMVFYVDKLCAMYPAFTISSLTVHRFLIAAATVAAKGLSDSFWTNSLYARVGGVSVRELALLELEFLTRVEWRIVPKPEVLVDYYKGLVERAAGHTMAKEATSILTNASPTPQSPAESATGMPTNLSNT